MIADLSRLREDVASLVRGRLPSGVDGISIEPSISRDGADLLLVTITLSGSQWDDDALERLLEEIETEVGKRDERYASVRFQDTA